ncbi:MAG: hypothetical protein Roseis2KO_49770 [Roseivirga sp.]
MRSETYKSLALLLIRLAFGIRLIYGVIDNVLSWERMLEFEAFLSANGFPLPLISAILSVYLQLIAGISWVIGYQVKYCALLMIGNFLVALVGFHIIQGDSYLNTAPAIHLLCISVLLLAIGPGKYALDKKKG